MELITWLDSKRGRAKALAAHVDKTPAAITIWRKEGVPLPLMRKVSTFTKGVVPVQTLLAHALACAEGRRKAVDEKSQQVA